MSAVTRSGARPGEELEQYRRELTGYCYRMLGSIYEAEDAVQETMLRAWRALDTVDDWTGLRPWLYRIATNVSLDMLKRRSRRALPMDIAPAATSSTRLRARRPDATWIQPAPDELIVPSTNDPEERALLRETVRLAFVAALQHLGPRQRAILILRDVLRWRAGEVAALLDTSRDAVNSALRRARASVAAIDPDAAESEPPESHRELLAAYIDAFDRHDVNALVALLRDDAIVQMPPFDLWLRGRDDIGEWLAAVGALNNHVLTPVDANASLAAAVYCPPTAGGTPRAHAIHVLETEGGRVSTIHSFIDPGLFPLFGLPIDLCH